MTPNAVEAKSSSEVTEWIGKVAGLSFPDYVQVITGTKELPESETTGDDMLLALLSSSSLEEGLGNRQAEGLRNHIGEEFIVNDFRPLKSEDQYAAGSPVFVVIDATMVDSGERLALTTGAKQVMGGLGLVLRDGRFGEHFTTKEVNTPSGKAINLIHVPTKTLDDGSKF